MMCNKRRITNWLITFIKIENKSNKGKQKRLKVNTSNSKVQFLCEKLYKSHFVSLKKKI
jgi:hypothetical protein